jgi:hypothetical protein
VRWLAGNRADTAFLDVYSILKLYSALEIIPPDAIVSA